MKTFAYTIKEELGIHARPAGLLMKEAKLYSSEITLHTNGKTADAKKLYAIMGLCVKKGMQVTVNIEGADEETAVEKIKEFFARNL